MILSLRCKLLSSLLGPKTPPHFIIYQDSWSQRVSGSFPSAETLLRGLFHPRIKQLRKGLGELQKPCLMPPSSASLQRWLFLRPSDMTELRVVLPSGPHLIHIESLQFSKAEKPECDYVDILNKCKMIT